MNDAYPDTDDLPENSTPPVSRPYHAAEETVAAVEAERRRLAALLRGQIVEPLNLLLAQVHVYEQTLAGNAQARLAISVLASLARSVLQGARDLEANLYPAVLEALGLEPALETLAGQEARARGLHITLAATRLRERLPYPLELALFRAAQDALDRASVYSHASHVALRLERHDDDLLFSAADNGLPGAGLETLEPARQRIEALGGTFEVQAGEQSGNDITIRFSLVPPVELTERETSVIGLLAEGLSNKEIARALGVSARTVNFHLDNIYSKLGVSTRTEAAVYALRQGLTRRPG